MKKNVLPYVIIICLFTGLLSCKKEFSSDEPLPKEFRPQLIVELEPRGLISLDLNSGAQLWENFSFWNWYNDTTPKRLFDLYHPVKFDSFFVYFAAYGPKFQNGHSFSEQEMYFNRIDGAYSEYQHAGIPITVNNRWRSNSPIQDIGHPVHLKIGNDVVIAYNNMICRYTPKKATSGQSQRYREVKWYLDDPRAYKTSLAKHHIGNSPEEYIFYTAGKTVCAVNAETGIELWRVTLPDVDTFRSAVCAANPNYLYVGNDNGKMYALNAADGSVFWSFQAGGAILSAPISIGGNVMFGSNDRNFYSVDSATGLLRWKVTTGDRILSAPYYHNQKVYFGSNDFNLYAVNVIDGSLVWKFLTYGAVLSAPLVHNNILYFGSYDKNIYALDPETGAQIWHRNVNYIPRNHLMIDFVNGESYSSLSGNYPY